MAWIRRTTIDPDYQSDDAAVDPTAYVNSNQADKPAGNVPCYTPGVPSTPSDGILDEFDLDGEESGEESGSDESSSESAVPIEEDA